MKKHIASLLILAMVFSLTACVSKKPKEEDINEEKNKIVEEHGKNADENQKTEIIEPTPKTDEKEVVLYFANEKYIETGDESLEHLLTENRIVKYGDISLEEAIVKELMKGPETDGLGTVIPSTVKLLGVEVSDGMAFVNFSQEGLFGSSMQESFTISQIVNSLLELDSVDKIQFLIDGEKAESLMGHFDIIEPFENIVD